MNTLLFLIGIFILFCIACVVVYTLLVIWMRFWWLILLGIFAIALVGIESFWRSVF